jgi:hypothetical protein
MFVTKNYQARGNIDSYLDRLQDLWGEGSIDEAWGENYLEEIFPDNSGENVTSKNHLNLVRDNQSSSWEIAA